MVAARKGKTGIAVGNVIGSCLFNAFLVLGVSALVRPLPFGDIGAVDLLTLTGASLLFWLFGCFFGRRTITRAKAPCSPSPTSPTSLTSASKVVAILAILAILAFLAG